MAKLLQRLGLAAGRHKTPVIAIWLLLLIAAGVGAVTLSGPTENSFSIPNAESSKALQTVEDKFPEMAAQGATANVVLVAPEGSTVQDPKVAGAITELVKTLGTVPEVERVQNPLDPQQPVVSEDARVALATVTFAGTQGNVDQASLDQVQAAVDTAQEAGLEVKVGGNAFQQIPEVFGPAEIAGVAIAFLVLMLTYGSLAAAGANLFTAVVGVGIGAAGITALTGIIDMQATTPILAVMLGLAVGIDYALFLFARFRSELRDGRPVMEAVGRATGTAGSAVVVAGLTVVIALVGLSVVGIPFLAEMGVAAAATVVIAVLVALTLVPAILAGLGTRVLRKSERTAAATTAATPATLRKADSPEGTGTSGTAVSGTGTSGSATTDDDGAANGHATDRGGFLFKWSNLVTKRSALMAVAGIVVLGVLAAPMFSMKTALPNDGSADPASQQRQAYDLIAENFGPGLSAPLLILVEGEDAPAKAAAVAQQVEQTPGVGLITPPQPSADGSVALFTAIPQTGPVDPATADLVNALRDHDFGAGVDVKVTGTTAVTIDVDETLASALPLYLVVVVGLALILLLLVFRSILVPITATLGFLLSFGTALGVTVAVFQWGWLGEMFGVTQPAPLMSLLPIIVVGILFGLAMDYQVFLVSRIHEAHAHGDNPINAIRHGFRRSAPVVIAAASIMAAVFGGFVGNHNEMIKPIALALTVGVLADAFLVRMIVIPSVLALLKGSAWWLPKWLDKVLPHVDVEGKAIEEAEAAERAAAGKHEATEVAAPSAHVPQHQA